MEDLPDALLAEIVKKITKTSDLNSLSLVSKRLYTVEAEQRGAIHVGCGLCPATEAMRALCSRYPNLWKVEIDYSGWTPDHGNQIDNHGFHFLSSCCPSLADVTLSFCSHVDDSCLAYLTNCKNMISLKLNSIPEITSSGLLLVAVGCKSLSTLHLTDCNGISGNDKWLECLGSAGSLEELVVKNCDGGKRISGHSEWLERLGLVEHGVNSCEGISQYDLLKFGSGWMKLQKFEFESKNRRWDLYVENHNNSFITSYTYVYDFCCENLKDLRLARIATEPELGLRFLLGKCKALEKLCLEYVNGLSDNDMIALSQSCSNLKSISIWLMPRFYDRGFTTALTDETLYALALSCPMLEAIELTFTGCESSYPSEIGFTQKGLLKLVQSCPIRVLALNGANFFDDEGMKAVSCAPFLETLDLVDCEAITDSGISFIVHTPCLTNLTLRYCRGVTSRGVTNLVHARNLQSLVVDGCRKISREAVEEVARSIQRKAVQEVAISVQYSVESASPGHFKRLW